MTEKRICWLYTQIDAPEDTHGTLKAQERTLLDYAALHGYEVTGTASDLGPSQGIHRPGIKRLLAAARKKQYNTLLLLSMARISRDPKDARMLSNMLDGFGVQMIVLSESHANGMGGCGNA